MTIEKHFSLPFETVNYVSNVSQKFNYFYLANLKVASSTILRTLQLAEVDGDERRLSGSPHDQESSPLLNFTRTKLSVDEVLSSERFFKFTYVRNPYTRVLSAYLDKVVRQPEERVRLLPSLGLDPGSSPSFLEFLRAIQATRDSWRDIHWMTQSKLTQVFQINYNYVGRFESFGATFPQILQRIGVATDMLTAAGRPENITDAASKVRNFIGREERELVISIYESDFLNFRYGLDPTVAHL